MSEVEAQVPAPEPEANELPTPEIQDMIQHAMNQEYSQANNIFGDLMTVKLNDVLDQESIRMADKIYNGVEEDEDPDEDQLELDLEAEGELESEESYDEEDDEIEDPDDEDYDDDEGLELEDDEEEENSSE